MNRKHRLTKSEQIISTIKSNQVVYSPIVNMFYQKNNSPIWQVAIVASKKKFKTAVQRNKIRRQLKAMIRELAIDLNNYCLVFLVKPEWLTKTYQENKQIIFKLLIKLAKGVVKDV